MCTSHPCKLWLFTYPSAFMGIPVWNTFTIFRTPRACVLWLCVLSVHWVSVNLRGFGPWGQWSACSATCDTGTRRRTRNCYGSCVGYFFENETCLVQYCSCGVGHWSSWLPWTSCTECQRSRVRTCQYQTKAGCSPVCLGSISDTERCSNVPQCKANTCNAADRSWSQWLEWGTCEMPVGSTSWCGNEGAAQTRQRTCVVVRGSSCSITDCPGKRFEYKDCVLCCKTRTGTWNSWGRWGACSVTCATGTRSRQRTCNWPPPATDPSVCTSGCNGKGKQTMQCVKEPCCTSNIPRWTEWSQWSVCSSSCGQGSRKRFRKCVPQGCRCDGFKRKEQLIFCTGPRPKAEWGQWSSYSQCSVTCGQGSQSRTRTCRGASDGCKCYGDGRKTIPCYKRNCPVPYNTDGSGTNTNAGGLQNGNTTGRNGTDDDGGPDKPDKTPGGLSGTAVGLLIVACLLGGLALLCTLAIVSSKNRSILMRKASRLRAYVYTPRQEVVAVRPNPPPLPAPVAYTARTPVPYAVGRHHRAGQVIPTAEELSSSFSPEESSALYSDSTVDFGLSGRY